jgi:twitching motility protein PilT
LHITGGLLDLQDTFVEEIFKSSKASVTQVLDYLKDPFKIKSGTAPPSVDAGSTALSPVVEPVMDEINYFHFEEEEFRPYPISLVKILYQVVQVGGSDLHLKVNQKPMVRINGKIQPLDLEEISANQIREILRTSFPPVYQKRFCKVKQLDCSFCHPDGERFRVNMFLSHAGIEVAFRHIHARIPTFEELCLPTDVFERVSLLQSGLVLITGVTGAGKSSTLASVIGTINRRDQKHIICIEDPIEYIHSNGRSVISHRQIGEHVDSYPDGLTACLREDPDIVLLGEMRDTETIKAVLKLAGTGHLVFSTFHTSSAPQTIEQLIQFFPPEERHNICAQLSFCLKAVICQFLGEDKNSKRRIPIFEILFTNVAVKNIIREGKTDKLASVMETSASEGMMSREQYLNRLLEMGAISPDAAKQYTKR